MLFFEMTNRGRRGIALDSRLSESGGGNVTNLGLGSCPATVVKCSPSPSRPQERSVPLSRVVLRPLIESRPGSRRSGQRVTGGGPGRIELPMPPKTSPGEVLGIWEFDTIAGCL